MCERHPVRFAGGEAATGEIFNAALRTSGTLDGDPRTQLLAKGIKAARNSLAYGLLCQVTRIQGKHERQHVVGPWGSFDVDATLELLGPYTCFVASAALTAFGRFMLSRVEAKWRALGGVIAGMDTDSVALVAIRDGGLVACLGGPEANAEGAACIRALPSAEALRILDQERWADPLGEASPWKVKHDSDKTEVRYAAICNKRNALHRVDQDGAIELLDASEHVLGGRYLDPYGTERRGPSGARRFVDEAWCHHLDPTRFPAPQWVGLPAVRVVALDRPEVVRRFWGAGVRLPFGELCQGEPDPIFGTAPGPIAPRVADPSIVRRWLDATTGETVRVALDTEAVQGASSADQVLATLGSVVRRWTETADERYREMGTAEAEGLPTGLLEPRELHTSAALTELIGRESTVWGSAFAGATELDDPEWLSVFGTVADPWDAVLLPALKRIGSPELANRTGTPLRSVERHLSSRLPPPSGAVEHYRSVAFAHARAALGRSAGPKARPKNPSPRMQLALVALWLQSAARGRLCEWHGCGTAVTGRQRFCSDTCRKRAKRKEWRDRLAEIGAVECRRCGTIRVSDTSGPCPICTGSALRPGVAICQGCRSEFCGVVPEACPFCGEAVA